MNLPPATSSYDRTNQTQISLAIAMADQMNHKKNQDVEVGDGRLIMKSPNGTRYEILVDNSGNLSASTV